MSRALANPDLISLAAGFVDEQTLPAEPTQRALEAIFSDRQSVVQAALQYGTTAGHLPLREAILTRFLRYEGTTASQAKLSIDQVVVTAGSNQLLHLVSESLIDPGDIVLCAAPTYVVFLGTLSSIGARSVGVCTDEDGMVPEALEERLKQFAAAGQLGRVKAIYLVAYFDNPTGATMPAERRFQIIEIAKRWSKRGKIHVIEDAAYREMRHKGRDVPSLRSFDEEGDTVVVAGTFSKSFSPGIRVGWGILPPSLVQPVCNQKGNIDFGSPNFCQHLMAKVLEMGLFDPHVERVREGYRRKLHAMLSAAEEFFEPLAGVRWIKPSGGLYVWLILPDGIEAGPTGRLFELAADEGVLYVPGQHCYPSEGEPECKNTIRLSFGMQSCENIRNGMESLARAIRQVMG